MGGLEVWWSRGLPCSGGWGLGSGGIGSAGCSRPLKTLLLALVPAVAHPTSVVVLGLGYWMMPTPPVVPSGIGLCLVLQLVASQMALPSRGCRRALLVVREWHCGWW